MGDNQWTGPKTPAEPNADSFWQFLFQKCENQNPLRKELFDSEGDRKQKNYF